MHNSEENNKEQKLGIAITLKEPDDFLLVKETLTRIGIESKKEKTLFQSCHILHKRGNYSILSFKELFVLDGKESQLTHEDIQRRNTIANLLDQWKLCSIINKEEVSDRLPVSSIKIVPYKEKQSWKLVPKYQLGSKKPV